MRQSIISISSLVIFFTIFQNVHMQNSFVSNEGASCLTGQLPDTSTDRKKLKNLYTGEQRFTIDLLRAINKATPNENIFFSPYSTYHALLLAYFGSSNTTEKELYNALNLNWAENKDVIRDVYKSSRRLRDYKDTAVEFKSADKIFLGENEPFRECMKQLFSDQLENMDFEKNPEESRKRINNWVSTTTNNEIPEFLQAGDISSQTRMVLANAAYFKGMWDTKFEKENTKMDVFYSGSEKRTFVEMMHNKGNYYFGISEQLGCHLLELQYKGANREFVSMIVLLPPMVNNASNLENVLNNLTPDNLQSAINDFESREIKVAFPKFSFEQRIELVPILNQIGIKEIFTNNADFSTFSEKGNFALGDATHFAKIKVDEEGATAAAATALFSFRSARPLEVTDFICNHPFLFLLYDHKSKAILFTGIYRSP